MEKVKNFAYKYRWYIFGLFVLIHMFAFLNRVSLAAVKSSLEQTFGINAFQYSNLSSAFFYTYAIMQIPSGILADTFGARKTCFIGGIVMAAGTVFFSLSASYSMLFVSRLLIGLGSSVIFLAILKIQATWFEERHFSKLTGLTNIFGYSGGALAQGPLAIVIGIFTWRATFLGLGILTAVLSIALFIVVRNKPEDKGYAPIVIIKQAAAAEKTGIFKTLAEIIKCRYMWPLMVINFFIIGINFSMTAWALPYFKDVYNLSVTHAGMITFFYPITAAVFGIVLGSISDKIGLRKIFTVSMLCVMCVLFAIIAFGNGGKPSITTSITVILLVGGFQTFTLLHFGIAKDLNNPKYSGMSTSIANVSMHIGSAVVPLFAGAIISKYMSVLGAQGAYQKVFILFLVIAIICVVLSAFIIETNCKNRYSQIREGKFNKSIFKLK